MTDIRETAQQARRVVRDAIMMETREAGQAALRDISALSRRLERVMAELDEATVWINEMMAASGDGGRDGKTGN